MLINLSVFLKIGAECAPGFGAGLPGTANGTTVQATITLGGDACVLEVAIDA